MAETERLGLVRILDISIGVTAGKFMSQSCKVRSNTSSLHEFLDS